MQRTIIEIAVYRGSALVLTLPGRVATKDVDAVFQNDPAWLRAAASAFAEERGWPLAIPPLVEQPQRFLDQPFFAGGLESLKAILLVESPLGFRRRQIFASADALSRPRESSSREA